MINPYFCYAFSFLTAIVVYLLGWSTLYPRLSVVLFAFLFLTIIINALLGWRTAKSQNLKFRSITFSKRSYPFLITAFIYILWALDFLYEGGIPLIKILFNQPYNYRLFGIPSLHVFIVTFSSFFTILLFHAYLSNKQRHLLILYFINLAAAVLIYSRAMFFFNLSGSFFLLLFWAKKPPAWLLCFLPIVLTGLFYCFGVLGTLRVSREAKVKYDNRLFLHSGKANDSFRESVIPKEFFWTYIYVSSPLANLQQNINTYEHQPISLKKTLGLINNEVLMDFISKRINGYIRVNREREHTIDGPFNVSTVYSRSFSYQGWLGMSIMFCVILVLPWIYVKLIPCDSAFFFSGFAILCTVFLFLAYDNMIRFTGLSFQLVYPIILYLVAEKLQLTKKFLMFT